MGFFIILIILIGIAFYFLPTIVGYMRHKRNELAIFLLNLFAGWSLIGWIVALVWAASVDKN